MGVTNRYIRSLDYSSYENIAGYLQRGYMGGYGVRTLMQI